MPLLAELENWPQFSRDSEDLHALCEQLSGPIGSVLLTGWKQPDYLVDCARQRNKPTTDSSADVQLYELVDIAELLQNPLKHASLTELPLPTSCLAQLMWAMSNSSCKSKLVCGF